jgi:uncharacterized membrane protein
MKPKEFLNQLGESKILEAISKAEETTSGEIRLFVSHHATRDAIRAAQKQFKKLGMTRTKHRNGVLIYFAPVSRSFAIVGDSGVHQKCGDSFWGEVSSLMAQHLKAGQPTEAITSAIKRVGELLARHFPPEPGDKNELPNEIAGD